MGVVINTRIDNRGDGRIWVLRLRGVTLKSWARCFYSIGETSSPLSHLICIQYD
jgi:hypothetical protein